MPALSPTMTAGNIGGWQKKAGDSLSPGDVLVEIETDKAQMDFEFQEEGVLAKILRDSGEKDIAVGSVRLLVSPVPVPMSLTSSSRSRSWLKRVQTLSRSAPSHSKTLEERKLHRHHPNRKQQTRPSPQDPTRVPPRQHLPRANHQEKRSRSRENPSPPEVDYRPA